MHLRKVTKIFITIYINVLLEIQKYFKEESSLFFFLKTLVGLFNRSLYIKQSKQQANTNSELNHSFFSRLLN